MSTPSTLTSRNLVVDQATLITRLPAGWPAVLGVGEAWLVEPPVECFPNRSYRVELDVASRTATIREQVAS